MQLREIWRALGMTVLFVTHSVTEAVFLADRIIVLSQRPARLLLDQNVALPEKRDVELRTALEYVNEGPALHCRGAGERRRVMTLRTRLASWWPPLLPLILLLVAAEIAVRMAWVPSYLIPAPSEVLQSLLDDRSELALAAWTTLSSALAGLLLSFVAGTFFAIALSSSDLARRAFYPYAVFFQTVPIISIAPLLVIWFGFGQPTVIASAAIVSVFPIIASTLLGLKSTEPVVARSVQTLRRVEPANALDVENTVRLAADFFRLADRVGPGGGGRHRR